MLYTQWAWKNIIFIIGNRKTVSCIKCIKSYLSLVLLVDQLTRVILIIIWPSKQYNCPNTKNFLIKKHWGNIKRIFLFEKIRSVSMERLIWKWRLWMIFTFELSMITFFFVENKGFSNQTLNNRNFLLLRNFSSVHTMHYLSLYQ